VSLEEVGAFLAEYGQPAAGELVGVARGTVNSSYEVRLPAGRLFLRLYEEQDLRGARAEADRLAYLERRGVPTPAPLARREGAFIGQLAGKPAALFPWRDGDMRCLAKVTPDDGRALGAALARLHEAARDAPRSPGRFEPEDLRARLERIERSGHAHLAAEAGPLRDKLARWERLRAPDLPRGLIHGDVFRDNVLWLPDGELSAILDFESASDGALAYDLLVTILAWAFRDEIDLGVARAIASGYEGVRPLSAGERRGLLAEGAIAAIRFTVTRITDEAMRALDEGRPPRADKDYRRFLRRLAWVEAQEDRGMDRVLLG
jgi:homoserine kinase type II